MSESHAPLPTLHTELAPDAILARLLQLSKRGKFAGFTTQANGSFFEAEAHGTIFDFRLVASRNDQELRFHLRPLWKLPIVVVIVTLLAAGPGLWLTQSMMLTYFSWYKLSLAWTAAWYEPLTIVPVPWVMWKAWKNSKHAAREHALEAIARIAAALDVPSPAPSAPGSN